MRSVALALIVSTLSANATLAAVRVELRAEVMVSCAVVGVETQVGGDLGRLRLTTICNRESFNIVLMGPDGPIEVISATSAQASVSAAANHMAVMLRAPGAQTFDVQLAGSLTNAEGVSAQIVAPS